MYFLSDNTSVAAPEMLDAISAANQTFAPSYGDDAWSTRLDAVCSEFFGASVRVFPISTGTAANSLALATLCPPYGSVFAHEQAHIVRDECGAVEGMSGGARLVALSGAGAKITPATLRRALRDHPINVHTPQPRALSISQCTELGQCYRPQELSELCECAHELGLRVHMDGARLSNALVFLDCSPAEITARAGVDVLSYGATKNGALAAEAVVFFAKDLVQDFELRRKRAGHLLSKMRYCSAQLLAMIETGLWRRHAAHANRLAQELANAAGPRLLLATEANEVFLRLTAAEARKLRDQGFGFSDWGAADSGEFRFVVSWNQQPQDIVALANALQVL